MSSAHPREAAFEVDALRQQNTRIVSDDVDSKTAIDNSAQMASRARSVAEQARKGADAAQQPAELRCSQRQDRSGVQAILEQVDD